MSGRMWLHGREVDPVEQPVQLLDSQFDEVGFLGPFEAVRFQALDEQPESVAIPEQYLDPVTPAVAEHISGLRKRVKPQPLFHEQGESVDAFAAIHRVPVQEDLQPGIESEHGRADSS